MITTLWKTQNVFCVPPQPLLEVLGCSGVKSIGRRRRLLSAASKAKITLPCAFWVKNSRILSLEMGMCHVLHHLEVATATDSCTHTWPGTMGAAMKSFLLLSLLSKRLSFGLGQGFHSGSPSSRLINLLISKYLAGVDVSLCHYDFYCSLPLGVPFCLYFKCSSSWK